MTYKNKTLATFLAVMLGSLGIHRFYLEGKRDPWAWLHFASLPLSLLWSHYFFGWPVLLTYSPLLLSFFAALLEALVAGLTPDEKWDHRHNPVSGRTNHSSWPLALLLVLTTGLGATALIAVIARAFDLLYTGGAYG
ncbi:NINE protein [Undibacterium oligocarboniphilum]|uniref:TM2 domain-containing protein n=1 Tax=Undibacterium oligocarboniphilum TaxID=666702 RepID=A0A850QD66_9BURK|nr:NINE protein [Undibacterium oligocarboniphilum]MBC3869665.1 TM2 domain-containing protein [Undibacterium oligocarboniphilum]NVO77268.1 TM2 domain-containing protein [Undibacterium oligocarboniphilum]